jgi:hypothetical protein
MTDLLNMLHDERATLVRKLAGVDAAIAALNGNAALKATKKKRTWTLSAEGRAKISKAAKLRWAKIKK